MRHALPGPRSDRERGLGAYPLMAGQRAVLYRVEPPKSGPKNSTKNSNRGLPKPSGPEAFHQSVQLLIGVELDLDSAALT